jgi:hypothetical protein
MPDKTKTYKTRFAVRFGADQNIFCPLSQDRLDANRDSSGFFDFGRMKILDVAKKNKEPRSIAENLTNQNH